MAGMPETAKELADSYVTALADLDPILATRLGLNPHEDRLPDLSPAGREATDDLARSTLLALDELTAAAANGDQLPPDRRCARLLRERLTAELAMSAQGEHLRAVSNIFGPPQRVRSVLLDMPASTEDDWAAIARRMSRIPLALAGYRASLATGADRHLLAGPRVTRAVADQLDGWTKQAGGKGWFADFAGAASAAGAAEGVSPALRAALDSAAAAANQAVADLAAWLAADYLPRLDGQPDGVGRDRYRTCARAWTGADIEPEDAYAWGWSQYQEIWEQMGAEADRVLPGASPKAAMRHLDEHGEAVEGTEPIRLWLQALMDAVIADLGGTHFDIPDPVKAVEARIAPAGSAAAPYYTPPSQDFARPGRTWLPTLGRTRFPLWNLVSVWYHEGVPGHHLQLAQWRYLAKDLSVYQTSVGGVSACAEGWALYAERLMDELGYLTMPGARLGYLDGQLMRAIRVVVDIGRHLRLRVPADAKELLGRGVAGQEWTPDLAQEFFAAHSGMGDDFVASEIVRYLSGPGQAISYKLGERAWLDGRSAARAAHGADFDLTSWHMAALSLGSLGLDDLAAELAVL